MLQPQKRLLKQRIGKPRTHYGEKYRQPWHANLSQRRVRARENGTNDYDRRNRR
jgi:hypothetical protein